MTHRGAWFLLLIATYPWLLGADLLSSSLATWGLSFFISGAVIVTPCRRLKRWQCVLFAASIGFLFEAMRPIPDGSVAMVLVFLAIYVNSYRTLLRSPSHILYAAITINTLVTLTWVTVAHLQCPPASAVDTFSFLYLAALQVSLSAILAGLFISPVSTAQNWVMDAIGLPVAEITA
jgi:hypothetical protein